MTINFSTEEHDSLLQQFDHFGFAYITRTRDEAADYEIGNVLETTFGRRVRISKIDLYNSLEEHPFKDQLTDEQIKRLSSSDEYSVIRLDLV